MRFFFFTCLFCITSVGTISAYVCIDNLYYNFDADKRTAEVVKIETRTSGDIVIPEIVTYRDTAYNVTSIGAYAFNSSTELTSVTIPNSIIEIGDGAFEGCSKISSPIFNSHVFAFLPASYSGKYVIPEGIDFIAGSAFRNCKQLTAVVIPTSVTRIGSDAFYGCSKISSPIYTEKIFAFLPTAYSGDYAIPDGIEIIAGGSFCNCKKMTDIEFPLSVRRIESGAFAHCTSLRSIEIPTGVTYIGGSTFEDCSNLMTVRIPSSVTLIKSFAFFDCYNLKYVIIDATIPPFVERAFSYEDKYPLYVPCGTLDTYKLAWGNYESRLHYFPLSHIVEGRVNCDSAGVVLTPQNICDSIVAIPNEGYHFVQWSDGNTDNPRAIELTQDTTFTAEFAKNSYTIQTKPNNPEWGTTTGDTTALYLDEIEISATPNYGYHFTQWSDRNKDNPRTIILKQDTAFTAKFAKNTYRITKQCNSEQGSVIGISQAEYLDSVTLTAVPNYGYHFTQWSDGILDNPRVVQIMQDTTFTAEFAIDRKGKCGNDLALVWNYDPEKQILTISGDGAFNDHMECGVEAKSAMKQLVIDKGVTSIGENAFSGCSSLTQLTIGETVKTINNNAFYNCVNLESVYNYRATPTNAYSTAFDGVDKFECKLFVLAGSVDLYKAAAVWRDFYYTFPMGAEEKPITTNDVTVEPTENTAVVTWPVSNGAATYTLQISKDGVVVCTLTFNANGQLTGIAFAPNRDGTNHAPGAMMTTNGLQFTVTGLDSGTHYALTVEAKDSEENVVATYSSEFTTTSEGGGTTAIDRVNPTTQFDGTTKILRNGQLLIQRGNELFNAQGARVK